jgi:hypothetical protein
MPLSPSNIANSITQLHTLIRSIRAPSYILFTFPFKTSCILLPSST